MRGSALGEIGEPMLFVLEVGTSAEEVLGVDIEDGDGMAELAPQTAEKLDDELLIGDRRADIVQSVSEHLQLVAVLGDRAVVLDKLMEFLLGVDSALQAVVEEEVVDRDPAAVCRVRWAEDEVADVLGDGVVEPGDDGVVDARPLDVVGAVAGVDGAVDVIDEIGRASCRERVYVLV